MLTHKCISSDEASDHFSHGLMTLALPSYVDSSLFTDERGFLSETPFGDGIDILKSDAPRWLLARYSVIVVSSDFFESGMSLLEVRDKLERFVERGGSVVITAGSLRRLPGGLHGVTAATCAGTDCGCTGFAAGTVVSTLDGSEVAEATSFELCPLYLPTKSVVTATARVKSDSSRQLGMIAAVRLSAGNGSVTVLASPFGVSATSVLPSFDSSQIDGYGWWIERANKRWPVSHPLLAHANATISAALREATLFTAGAGLAVSVNRVAAGEYHVTLINPGVEARPFKISSTIFSVRSVQERHLEQQSRDAVGFFPPYINRTRVGRSDATTIAGYDARIFVVLCDEGERTVVVPPVTSARPKNIALTIGKMEGRPYQSAALRSSLRRRPTFFQSYDSIVTDARYLASRDQGSIASEGEWLASRQGLRIVVDFSDWASRLQPKLRLMNDVRACGSLVGCLELRLMLSHSPRIIHWTSKRLSGRSQTCF